MFKIFNATMLAAALGLTSLVGFAGTAQAGDVRIIIGGNDRPGRGMHHHRMNACTPDRAENKAERSGLNRTRVINVSRTAIKVAGRKHGRGIVMVYGRAPGCPLLTTSWVR